MIRVCVFAGSSGSVEVKYLDAARALGAAIARRGMGMVYGGGAVGLMGACADAALQGHAEVVGVLPRALARSEVAHPNLTELRIVGSMHERKATMASLADGFIALPGGLGTLDETFEVLTWAQLGLHTKPVGVLNVDGYWDGLRRLLGHAVEERFVRPEHAALLLFGDAPGDLLDRLSQRSLASPRAST